MPIADLTADDVYRLYKGNSPFGRELCFADFLNQSLRDGLQLAPPWSTASQLLDVLIANSIAKSPMILYRATIDSFVAPYISDGRLVYPAYMSTSTDEGSIQRHFATAFRGVTAALLRIECPGGLPALDMEANASFGGYEREVLLPRGAQFEIHLDSETNDPAKIAEITSAVYAKSYTSLRTYLLRYVA